MAWIETRDLYFRGVSTMPICLGMETATSDVSSWRLNAAIAIVLLVIGWFLKVLSDRRSQKKLFDHRLRLEKEYGLYSDLWDKLFELRRAVGQLFEPLVGTSAVRHDEQVHDRFNAYQAAVRKGEPFMSTSIFRPAREIAKLARKIMSNIDTQRSLSERREQRLSAEADEKLADKQIRLDEENEASFNSIEDLYQQIAQAIRLRVTP